MHSTPFVVGTQLLSVAAWLVVLVVGIVDVVRRRFRRGFMLLCLCVVAIMFPMVDMLDVSESVRLWAFAGLFAVLAAALMVVRLTVGDDGE